jgi:proline iminopeptidase
VSFVIWFVYALGHPRPDEPRFLYRFRRHPSAIPEYLAYLARGLFHPHLLRTGSTPQERVEPLPGDDLLADPGWQETRATTVDIPAGELWPWIVQMGGSRGGWYWWTPGEAFPEYAAYVTNTYEVLEQFQTLSVGDRLSDGGPYATAERGNWIVRAIEPNRYLVLHGARQMTAGPDFEAGKQTPKGMWFESSWAFVLKPIGPEQTRLLVRVRIKGGPAWLFRAMMLTLGKGDTSAHASMLERIKARSEAAYYSRARRETPITLG